MWFRCVALALTVIIVLPAPTLSASCILSYRFHVLNDLIRHAEGPEKVGRCTGDYLVKNRIGMQATTNGVFIWSDAHGRASFSDGERTWLESPFGLEVREGGFTVETLTGSAEPTTSSDKETYVDTLALVVHVLSQLPETYAAGNRVYNTRDISVLAIEHPTCATFGSDGLAFFGIRGGRHVICLSVVEDDYRTHLRVGEIYAGRGGYDAARLYVLAHEFAHAFTLHIAVLCRQSDECIHKHSDFQQKEMEFVKKIFTSYFDL